MAQRKVDPISLLRDAFVSNSKVTLSDNALVFGSQLKLPLDTPTAWQPQDNLKRYTIGDLWLFLESNRTDLSNYYQRVGEFKGKIHMVSMQHQSNLIRRDRGVLYREKRLFRLYK